jgi:hypothetical protein
VNVKGEVADAPGVTDPAPSSVIVTDVALMNVLPVMVTGVTPQVLPLVLLRVIAGALTQPQETEKIDPVVVHPEAFLTVMA